MKNPAKLLRARRDFHIINKDTSSTFTGFRQEFEAKMDEKHENKAFDCAEQWIIQKRSAEPSHSGEWRGDIYVVSRDALIGLSVKRGLLSDPLKRAVLEALPPQTLNTPVIPCNLQMEDE